MTIQTAWRVIEESRRWNTGQTSTSMAFKGVRTLEDDLLDQRRKTLMEAWRVVRDADGVDPPVVDLRHFGDIGAQVKA